jgi:hypothetical protein
VRGRENNGTRIHPTYLFTYYTYIFLIHNDIHTYISRLTSPHTYICPHTFSHTHTFLLHTFPTYKYMYATLSTYIRMYVAHTTSFSKMYVCMWHIQLKLNVCTTLVLTLKRERRFYYKRQISENSKTSKCFQNCFKAKPFRKHLLKVLPFALLCPFSVKTVQNSENSQLPNASSKCFQIAKMSAILCIACVWRLVTSSPSLPPLTWHVRNLAKTVSWSTAALCHYYR